MDEQRVQNTMGKMGYYLSTHNCICVSISGGADSDVILHIVCTYFREHLPKVHFLFCDTGLEYKATKEHLVYLEEHYGIKIERIDASGKHNSLGIRNYSVPYAVRKYGVPFMSKQYSEFLSRLQKHGVPWSRGGYSDLLREHPNCSAALKWWCNANGENSRFNIEHRRGLKEVMLQEQPACKFSAKCCTVSKKKPMHEYERKLGADLVVTGERKTEGGVRAVMHKSCFSQKAGEADRYMPLFFWDDETKNGFIKKENIRRSDCYEVYGMRRTGCSGCPFALKRKEELAIMQQYEPNLYRACNHVFGEAYRLTDLVDEWREAHKPLRNDFGKDQITFFEEEQK